MRRLRPCCCGTEILWTINAAVCKVTYSQKCFLVYVCLWKQNIQPRPFHRQTHFPLADRSDLIKLTGPDLPKWHTVLWRHYWYYNSINLLLHALCLIVTLLLYWSSTFHGLVGCWYARNHHIMILMIQLHKPQSSCVHVNIRFIVDLLAMNCIVFSLRVCCHCNVLFVQPCFSHHSVIFVVCVVAATYRSIHYVHTL